MRKLLAVFSLVLLAGLTFAEAQTPDYYRVGGSVAAPRKVIDVAPVYPDAARAQGIEGTVIAELKINAQGTVDEARIIRSIPALDEAALAAVKQWAYQPPLLNGAPMPILYNVTVTFSLRTASSPAAGGQAAPASAAAAISSSRQFSTVDPALLDPPPLHVGGAIKAPTKIYDVAPEYPFIAQQANVEGVVILELLVDQNGIVANAKVIRSVTLLDEAALDAVRQWVYTPTLLNGAPVSIYYNVTVSFSLK